MTTPSIPRQRSESHIIRSLRLWIDTTTIRVVQPKLWKLTHLFRSGGNDEFSTSDEFIVESSYRTESFLAKRGEKGRRRANR